MTTVMIVFAVGFCIILFFSWCIVRSGKSADNDTEEEIDLPKQRPVITYMKEDEYGYEGASIPHEYFSETLSAN